MATNIASIQSVKADPESLKSAAERAFADIKRYQAGLDAITTLVRESEGYWEGEAGEAFRAVYDAESAKALEALDEFARYPQDLLAFAGIYSQAIEKANQEAEGIETSSFGELMQA